MKNKLYFFAILFFGIIMAGCSSEDDHTSSSVQEDTDTIHLKVMTYNIYSGQKVYSGPTGVEAIAEVIKQVNPDIVGLEEFETKSSVVDYQDMISLLKEETGLSYSFFVHTTYPHGGDYGNLILSKYPLSEGKRYLLPREDTDVDIYPRAMGIVSVVKNHTNFHFMVTHLSSTLESNRILQAQSIMDTIADVTGSIILVGDMNAYADSSPLNIFYQRFVISCLNGDYGLTIDTPIPTKAIDFILHTPDQGITPLSYNVDYDAYYQSDHFPVVATFSIKKNN